MSGESPYITNDQGYVTSGAKSADYGSNYLAGQNIGNTSPSNTGTGNADQVWNQYWNEGFNNPYSVQTYSDPNAQAGYQAGTAEYFKRNPITTTPTGSTTNNTTTNTGDGFDMKYYPGWDETAARQDWAATGGSKAGGTTGGNGYSDALNASRNAFNSAYDPVFQQLDQMAGLIPQQQVTRQNSVNDLYRSQQNELSTNMQGSLGALDTSTAQVAAQKAQSIRDLQQQMNQMSKAGGMQLGSAGAGDSSAARMYNFALSKAAGQSSADVSNQANSQYAQIQAQGQQIKATYDDQMAKLSTWKADNTNQVVQWAQDQLSQIQQAKLSATGQKAAALAATETGLIQNALSRIQQIDDQITSWNEGIQTWALNRMATIDDAKAKISGYGQYTTQDIVANKLQGLNNVQGANSGGMTGYYNAQKKDEQNFLNSFK